jgi:ABC-2 type transport system ATP-binding protein
MERCHVTARRRHTLGTLSKGYRQRVGLAATLIHDPKVLILDEPTVGLDPVEIRKTREMIRGLAEDHTVLLSTHILSEVEQICGRVIIVRSGEIIADANMDELVRDQGRAVVEVAAEAPAGALAEALGALTDAEVDTLTADDGPERCRVTAADGGDLGPAIGRMLHERGWTCLSLSSRRETLEDIYVRVTQTEKVI